jgi:hypothetical protein
VLQKYWNNRCQKIFSVDEVVLFHSAHPNKIMSGKGETCLGGKKCKVVYSSTALKDSKILHVLVS